MLDGWAVHRTGLASWMLPLAISLAQLAEHRTRPRAARAVRSRVRHTHGRPATVCRVPLGRAAMEAQPRQGRDPDRGASQALAVHTA